MRVSGVPTSVELRLNAIGKAAVREIANSCPSLALKC